MKNSILILLICCAFQPAISHAQTAPDFTVTDSWGQTHSLYSDYLDEDKTVVLKIFYVACPPCNAIAPHLEPLYQTWGGGDGDVQFIELSTKQSDTDVLVNGYKSNHGTTYPAAGGQGNSVQAATPYMNGTFGLWTGTPTFAVIAPDGSVNYDVHGINIEGTISALNDAIAATGADGVATSVSNRFEKQSITFNSRIVRDELIIHVNEDLGHLSFHILNTSGQLFNAMKADALQKIPIRLDVAMLSEGTWICRITDEDHRIVASYLFIKM